MDFGWGLDVYVVPNNLPLSVLLITKRIEPPCSRETDTELVGQTIKDNITNNSPNLAPHPSGWTLRERANIISRVFLPEIHHPDRIMRKHQTNPNRVTFYKINGLYFSKMSRLKKEKGQVKIKYDWRIVWVPKKLRYCDNFSSWAKRMIVLSKQGKTFGFRLWICWYYWINVWFPDSDRCSIVMQKECTCF